MRQSYAMRGTSDKLLNLFPELPSGGTSFVRRQGLSHGRGADTRLLAKHKCVADRWDREFLEPKRYTEHCVHACCFAHKPIFSIWDKPELCCSIVDLSLQPASVNPPRRHLGLGCFGTLWCEPHNWHTAFAGIHGRRHLVRVWPGPENEADVGGRHHIQTASSADLSWPAPLFPAEINPNSSESGSNDARRPPKRAVRRCSAQGTETSVTWSNPPLYKSIFARKMGKNSSKKSGPTLLAK